MTEKEAKAKANRMTLRLGKPLVAIRFGDDWIIATPMKEKKYRIIHMVGAKFGYQYKPAPITVTP